MLGLTWQSYSLQFVGILFKLPFQNQELGGEGQVDGRLVLERTGKSSACNTSRVNFNLTIKNF